MQWVDRMNDAMNYVESHLTKQIDPNEISRILACPFSLFQRTFALVTGLQFSEYLRRRRLSCAAHDLRNTTSRIIDIAVKYGYESSDAFSAAFKKLHGIPPSKVRESSVELKFFPKLSFSLMLSGVTELAYRIKTIKAFSVLGIRKKVPDGHINWRYISADERWSKLQEQNGQPCKIGVCFGYDMEGKNDYMCAIEHPGISGHGFDDYHFPTLTWLIFSAQGPFDNGEFFYKVNQRIFGEFLPQSTYTVLDLPIIEHFHLWDATGDRCRFEIKIPIQGDAV